MKEKQKKSVRKTRARKKQTKNVQRRFLRVLCVCVRIEKNGNGVYSLTLDFGNNMNNMKNRHVNRSRKKALHFRVRDPCKITNKFVIYVMFTLHIYI